MPRDVFERCAVLLRAKEAGWVPDAWETSPWDAGVNLISGRGNGLSQLQIARDLGISRDQVRFVGESIGVLHRRPSRQRKQA